MTYTVPDDAASAISLPATIEDSFVITRRQHHGLVFEQFISAKHREVMAALKPHYNGDYVSTLICAEILNEWLTIVAPGMARGFDKMWCWFQYGLLAMTDINIANYLSVTTDEMCNLSQKRDRVHQFVNNLDNRIAQYC